MSGIYIHIPFCKQACHYCDFHFSTNLSRKDDMVDAIVKELNLQRNYLKGEEVSSIYFGGGTPSLLGGEHLAGILKAVHKQYEVAEKVEITLEANPDDIQAEMLQEYVQIGINRLSLGIQSFNPEILTWMNRAHDTNQAHAAISQIKASGVHNLSVDLIYGVPISNSDGLSADLEQLLVYKPQHISAYCLTIEEKTVFGWQRKKGKLKEVDEDIAAEQFLLIKQTLEKAGYIQYEVSNYCLPAFKSFHNTNYWRGISYLGIGPGAHSFNGQSRQFNVTNNAQYLSEITKGRIPSQEEWLSKEDQINEYIMTSLRTMEGLSNEYLITKFNFNLMKYHQKVIQTWVDSNLCQLENGHSISLTKEGLLLADKLASDLFLTD